MSAFFSRPLILGITGVVLLGLVACGTDSDTGDDDMVQVVTTLPLFANMIQEVGGDRVRIDALLPSGADPHTYEPAPRAVATVAEADVAFVNGLGLEPTTQSLIEANISGDALVVTLSDPPGPAGPAVLDVDPHRWMSPDLARGYAENIRAALAKADPGGGGTYAANFEAYRARLEATGDYMRDTVASVPEARRKLITTHAAFGYLAEYLGFEVSAALSAGPGQEASPEDVRAIVETIDKEGVPAVFAEPQVSGEKDILEQAAEDAGAVVCTLYSDSLDSRAPTYLDMMRFNADEIARCLGGGRGG